MNKTEDVGSDVRKVLGEIISTDTMFADKVISMVASANQEILILCGTRKDIELIERNGILSKCKDKVNAGTKARLLIPDGSDTKIVQPPIKIKVLDSSLNNATSIIMADKKELLLWKSWKDNLGGNALFVDEDSIVASYAGIFESLWNHIDKDEEMKRSRNELARMTADSELLFASLAESNKALLAANERLAENDQMQREFINVAAHELRTPIQPILMVANIIENMFESGKEKVEITKGDIDMIIRNAKRLERLSSEILEVARIESHSFRLNKELLRLNEIIQNAMKDMSSRESQKNNSLRLECHASNEVYIYGDKERLNEVIYNLLDNAVKFTPHGLVSISTTIEKNEVMIQVRDTGAGIDPQIHPKLFSKFATKSEKGTGLGLYISKRIIEAHGGKIWAENNMDGKGATFTFVLPLN